MYNSERMMKAIGDISDDKIEKTGRALGYQKEERRMSHAPVRMGRLLSIAAVVALILALGAVAYATNIFGPAGALCQPKPWRHARGGCKPDCQPERGSRRRRLEWPAYWKPIAMRERCSSPFA